MTPSLALAYLFWTRYRRGLILVCGYWLAVMIFCLAVPAGHLKFAAGEGGWFALMALALSYSSFLAAIDLILVFTFVPEVRLQACESSFPSRLLALPLRTRSLAGWSMLWGSAAMILDWMTLAWAAGRFDESDVPLLWPGLMLAGFLAWLQAVLWTPFPMPWVRGYLLILVMLVFGSTTIAVIWFGVPSLAVCGLFAVLLLAAYGTAVRGVARARHGDNVKWGWPAWLRWPWAARTRPPFLSAARAQLWFEWRLHGLFFPCLITSVAVIALSILFLVKNLGDLDGEDRSWIQALLQMGFGMLWIPAAVWMSGVEMGRFGRGRYSLSSFLATRPVSEAMLVRTKFIAAAWNALAGWSVLAIGLLLWLALIGDAPEAVQQFEAIRQRHEPGRFWGWLIFLAGGTMVLTWLQMIQSMWIGQLRSTRVMIGTLLCGVYALVGLIVFGCLLKYNPEYWSEYWPVFHRQLPWLAGAAVLLKILAAVWSLHALRRRRLIPSDVLWGMLAIWFGLAVGLFAVLYALLPDDWFSVPGVVLGIMLLLPLTRLALAPLALSRNRHR